VKRPRRKETSAEKGARAFARKLALLKVLSPDRRCQMPACGRRCRAWDGLEVDHVDGRDWSPRKLNRWSRVARYWREYEAGVRLRALCRSCNAGYNPKRRASSRRALARRLARGVDPAPREAT
jgi:hypothetical protein